MREWKDRGGEGSGRIGEVRGEWKDRGGEGSGRIGEVREWKVRGR